MAECADWKLGVASGPVPGPRIALMIRHKVVLESPGGRSVQLTDVKPGPPGLSDTQHQVIFI